MGRKRMLPPDEGLRAPVKAFEDTFSAETVIKETWFTDLLTDKEKAQLAQRDARKWLGLN